MTGDRPPDDAEPADAAADKPVAEAATRGEPLPAGSSEPTGEPDAAPASDRTDDKTGLSEDESERSDGAGEGASEPAAVGAGGRRGRWPSRTGLLILALCALLGVALAAQLRSTEQNSALPTARQEDLVRILDELEARDQRLRAEIGDLETRRRAINSEAQGSENALEDVRRRSTALGILAGTLAAEGPGVQVSVALDPDPTDGRRPAEIILDAVQELRGAGAEAMQVSGSDGKPVRIVASTAFVDVEGGIEVDRQRLTGPYELAVIGDPETMTAALNIAGGVVDTIRRAGGSVQVEQPAVVVVDAVRTPRAPRFAKPES